MKRCPACGRTFTNNTLVNCLNDGTALVEDVPAPPPYLGAPSAAPQSFAETPPSEAPGTATYTDTPLSAIPELQSPEIQAALKEALDKAGMSGLLGVGLQASNFTVTTHTTTSHSETPFASPQFATPQTQPLGFAQTPTPPYAAAAMPRRKRSPWGGLLFWLLLLIAAIVGFQYFHHRTDVPANIVTAVKNADAAEVSAVGSLNPHPLVSAYTGPALAQEIARLASLRAAKTSEDERLVSQEFSGYQASADGTQAKVDVTETWDTDTYSEPGHKAISQKSDDVSPQTVYLTRKAGGWVVEKIVFHRS